jgi:NAD(P)H-hydrate epimerase
MEEFTIGREYVSKKIPARRRDSHKGMNGAVCVIGGSRVYHGAPFLTAMAAMRTGVDLVYLAVPNVISSAVRSLSPDLIVIPLPDAKLTRGNVAKLKAWLPEVDSIAIGPGLGYQNERDLENAISQLREKCKSMVVDADALRPPILKEVKMAPTVVTPHAGEFQRLFGVELSPDLESRVASVSKSAQEHGLTVLLKGPTDIVSDGQRVALNETHSPSMTVGGTGDVLTGVTSGLLAKGMNPFDAAYCAIFINGSAGVEATQEMGLHITASDVVRHIASAMKAFDRID